jgi:maleylacetate reductase
VAADEFLLAQPGRVIFGPGTVGRVPDEVAYLGAERVLLVVSGSALGAGRKIAAGLGHRLAATWHETAQHVPEQLAESARWRANAVRADAIVCVGGGSATGLAKAVAVDTRVPIVAVPTTYAGSEVTPVYGITGTRKTTARDPAALPRVVVYDPRLTVGLSPRSTAASGLNAVAHAVEARYTPGANPVTDLYAVAAVRRLATALPRALADPADLAARGDALVGAYLAGLSFAGAGSALHHRMCHVLGGDYDLVHAEVHSALLPYTVAAVEPFATAELAPIATTLHATSAATGLYDLAVALGAPLGLAAIGLPVDELDAATRRCTAAVADLASPVVLRERAVRALLADAYAGNRPGTG